VFGFNLEKFEQITRIPAGRVDSRLDPGGLESMSMSLLQRTISESQIWPTSNTELPRNAVSRHGRRGIASSIKKSPKSGKELGSNPAAEERCLIQRALAGDPDALSPLFARYRPRLFRAASSLLRNREDAEDALQDGLLSAYVHLNSFQGRSQFSTWLTRIVVNAALMALRRKRARPETSLDESQHGSLDDWPARVVDFRPNPEQVCAAMEAKQAIEKHVDQLSAGVRSAFRLRVVEGLSTKEAREVLGVSENVVKSRLLRARVRLAEMLREPLETPLRETADIAMVTAVGRCL
jgi:RNA polymerase sigma-70 factor, ECF subfamily